MFGCLLPAITAQIRNVKRDNITPGSALRSPVWPPSKSLQSSLRSWHLPPTCPHFSKLEKLLWWGLRYFLWSSRRGSWECCLLNSLLSHSFDKQIRSTNKVSSKARATPSNLFRFPRSFLFAAASRTNNLLKLHNINSAVHPSLLLINTLDQIQAVFASKRKSALLLVTS